MSNFQILAKTEQTEESSYTIKSTGETVTKVQITLSVPGMSDRVICEMPLDVAPTAATLEQWEMDESWVVVSANGFRALGFTRANARPGEKPVGAMVIFQATEVREASPEERKQLQEARKAARIANKQRRAARQAQA
jgi:hypothetical protein